jgi:uncharacterized membrane protein
MTRHRPTSRPARRSRQAGLPIADPAGPGLAIVLLGLGSAIAFGAGDFGGGWTSRRASVFAVSAAVQALGLAVAIALGVAVGEPFPGPSTIAFGVLGGAVGVLGILGLYHGLAVGRMGVVAPISGVLGAIVPVIVGMLIAGPPNAQVLLGIAFAVIAVPLVSASRSGDDRPSGLRFAILGGIGIGLFGATFGAIPDGEVAWPLAIFKISALVTIGIAALIARASLRLPAAIVPAVIGVAVLDLTGNGLFLLAAQLGRLDIAATLSSLYPVSTVILAWAVLKERLSRLHLLGIVVAAIAIALIGGGTATG